MPECCHESEAFYTKRSEQLRMLFRTAANIQTRYLTNNTMLLLFARLKLKIRPVGK